MNERIKDYRKYYQKITGIELPESFEIHHIDFNRDNNCITNLVAIPKELHNNYHNTYNDVVLNVDLKDYMPSSFVEGGHRGLFYISEMLNIHLSNHSKVQEWIDYKYHLLGLFPNVHNLTY